MIDILPQTVKFVIFTVDDIQTDVTVALCGKKDADALLESFLSANHSWECSPLFQGFPFVDNGSHYGSVAKFLDHSLDHVLCNTFHTNRCQ